MFLYNKTLLFSFANIILNDYIKNSTTAFILLLLAAPVCLSAQISGTPSYYPPSKDWRMALSYNQDNNIYYWRGEAGFSRQIGNGTISFIDNFDINRITTRFADDKWKDINDLNANLSYPVFENISFVLKGTSNYISDLQSGFLNNILEHTVSTELPVIAWNSVSINPQFGYKWDKRISKPDKGFRKGLDISVIETKVGDYYGRAQGRLFSENLDGRVNNVRNLNVSVHRTFYGETSDTLTFNQNRMRHDYYVSEAGDLQSRRENGRRISNILYYSLWQKGLVRIQSELSKTAVDILSFRKDQETQKLTRNYDNSLLNVILSVKVRDHTAKLHFNYDNSKQRNENITIKKLVWGLPFDAQDYNEQKIEIGGSLNGKISKKHSYVVETFIEKFRYDTPSESDYDDHDELRFGFNSLNSYSFNPRLTLSVNTLVSLNHLVYIFEQRSADNNWNRIFEAGTQVDYNNPGGIRFTGKYKVLANYVDYDYDDIFIQVSSFVFRKFSMDHVFSLPVTEKGELFVKFQVDFEENGMLKWKEFIQNVLIDRKIIIGQINYDYKWSSKFHIKPGFSTFKRTEKNNLAAGTNRQQSRLWSVTNNGVILSLEYMVSPSAQLRFNASKRFIKRGSIKENFRLVDLAVNWLF